MESEQKYFVRPSISNCIFLCVLVFLVYLGLLWGTMRLFVGTFGYGISLFEAITVFVGTSILRITGKDPHVGFPINACESLGKTMAVSVIFWPLPIYRCLLIGIGFMLVEYYCSLTRIARLKKQGYVEKPESEAHPS